MINNQFYPTPKKPARRMWAKFAKNKPNNNPSIDLDAIRAEMTMQLG